MATEELDSLYPQIKPLLISSIKKGKLTPMEIGVIAEETSSPEIWKTIKEKGFMEEIFLSIMNKSASRFLRQKNPNYC